jgi:hypothetical protein
VKIWIVAALVGLSSPAFAELKCSDAQARIQLVVGHYEGGAAPRPGQRLRWSDLTRDGNKIEDVAYLFNDKRVLSFKKDRMNSTEIFAAAATFTTKDGENISEYVICRDEVYLGPPRP